MRVLKYLIFIIIFLFTFVSKVSAINLTISNPIVSNDEVAIKVDISGLTSSSCPLTKCYFQGMFTKTVSPAHYFGFTKNNYGDGDWYKYFWSPSKEEIQSTYFYFVPENGNWSGLLNVKNDPSDPDYVGPGDYLLRIRRYTGNSDNGPTSEESNDLPIQLTYVIPTSTPTDTPVSTPTSTPTPNPTTAPTKTPTPTPTKSPTPKPTSTSSPTPTSGELVLGIQNSSPTPVASSEEATTSKNFPIFPVILIVTGFFCIGGGIFFFIKNNVKRGNEKEGN
jgi:hypothetical protein